MARPKELIDEGIAEKASMELAKIRNYKVCIRLLAIVICKDYPINHVAKMMRVDRSSLWRWIRRFKEGGVAALYDKPKGHNPAKLDEKHKREIMIWLKERINQKEEEVHWTLEKLRSEIKVVFEIMISTTALWKVIRNMGFVQKVPRPYHSKSDKNEQEVFKKNC